MFFNCMNLDTKLGVAILAQDFALCCDIFSISADWYWILLDIYLAFVYFIRQWFNLYPVFGSHLYFLWD